MVVTVQQALYFMWRDPWGVILRKWNWKSALFSAFIRGMMFFLINRKVGRGVAAMVAEFCFFIFAAGFFGAVTQNFRHAHPRWLSKLTVVALVLATTHTSEFILHQWIVQTPRALVSVLTSVGFTCLSTIFSFYVMRRGAMVVGAEGNSFGSDIRRMPGLVLSFLTEPFKP